MISGHDITIRNPAGPEHAFEEALRVAQHVWPDAVAEDGDTGEFIRTDLQWNAFAGLRAIMIYKDPIAREAWENQGGVCENLNKMIHLVAEWEKITIVVDDPNQAEVKQIIKGIKSIIQRIGQDGYAGVGT